MGRLRRILFIAGAAVAVAAGGAAAVPSAALAYGHEYCFNSLAPGGTCPPAGVGTGVEWTHLEGNEIEDPYGSHATCADSYLDGNNNGHYTTAHCVYYRSEMPYVEYPGGEWGYPRAWNGGSVTHTVKGYENGH
jgi:hypothetical protein